MPSLPHALQFYIDGAWVDPIAAHPFDVIDPSTEEAFAQISLGTAADVDRAVMAARRAFGSFSRTGAGERRELMASIVETYRRRSRDLADVVSREMGAPRPFALAAQVASGLAHLEKMVELLGSLPFERRQGSSLIAHEPVGVVGLITPWNWPLNQIACKVAPALGAGCTMVLKPSEIAPLDAILFAEILDEAGVPAGVFNLVNGDGPTVGQALAAHPDVEMMSFTGSTRAGILVAKAAADTVKRVHQELGGKSANILLPDVDLEQAVSRGVVASYLNCGQSCDAPTRMFVPRERHSEAAAIAARAADAVRVGPPDQDGTMLGPLVSRMQFDKVQGLIQSGIEEGARLVAGGAGRPAGLNRGYYARPTVFAEVEPAMRIAREEIFGPVLSILSYGSVDEAVELANDTPYGLAAYVQARDLDRARDVAARLRAGSVHINYAEYDPHLPFGGYKQSGNGREHGEHGLESFLETKAVLGYAGA